MVNSLTQQILSCADNHLHLVKNPPFCTWCKRGVFAPGDLRMGSIVIKSNYLANSKALAQGFASGALAKDQAGLQTVMTLEVGLETERENNNVALLVLVAAYKKALILGKSEEIEALGPAIAEVIREEAQKLDRLLTLRFGSMRFASKGEVTAKISRALASARAGARAEVSVFADWNAVKRNKPTTFLLSAAPRNSQRWGLTTEEEELELDIWEYRTTLRRVNPATRERLYLQAKGMLDFFRQVLRSEDPKTLHRLSSLWTSFPKLQEILDLAHANGLVAYLDFLIEGSVFELCLFFGGEIYNPCVLFPRAIWSRDRKHFIVFLKSEGEQIIQIPAGFEKAGSSSLLFQGEVFTWDGKDSFKNEWGDALKTNPPLRTGSHYSINVYPEVIPAHPKGLVGVGSIFYMGQHYEVKPFEGKVNHYILSKGLDDEGFLVAFDEKDRRIHFAEGVFLYPGESEIFFVDGYFHRAMDMVGTEQKGFLYDTWSSNGGPPVPIWKGPDGSFSKFQDEKTGILLRGTRFFFAGELYSSLFEREGILYAAKDPKGFFDSWFVGRRLPSEDGLTRVVPLQEEELKREFKRLLDRASKKWGGKNLPFSKLPRPKTITTLKVKKGTWKSRAMTESGNPIPFAKYELQIDGEHTIRLFLPSEESPVSSPLWWERGLKKFPRKVLLGVKEIVVVPSEEKLKGRIRRVGAYFDQKKRRLVVRTVSKSSTLYHEILGHGTELKDPLFDSLVILAARLDGRIIGDYAMHTMGEHYARGAEILALHPPFHRDYPHLMKLLRRMADVNRDR